MIDIKKARRIPKNADLSRIHPDLRDKAVPCSLLTQEGRICYGMERSPAYVAVILQRAKDAGMSPRLADA